MKADGARDWVQLFLRKDRLNDFDDPDNPTLQPWMLTTQAAGAALRRRCATPTSTASTARASSCPISTGSSCEIVDGKLIPIKTGAGEADLQARRLVFKDYTFLQGERGQRSGLTTLLWPEARSAHLALYPNLNATDPVWRGLFRDLRFRQALSLGLDRDAISQYPLLRPGRCRRTTRSCPTARLWQDESGDRVRGVRPRHRQRACSTSSASTSAAPDGTRLLPDGRPMEIVVETSGEDTEQSDVLELVRRPVGADRLQDLRPRPSDRADHAQPRLCRRGPDDDVLRHRQRRAVAHPCRPRTSPRPAQGDQLQWPKWGQYYETNGEAGEPPDLPEAKRLMDLYKEWTTASEERADRDLAGDAEDLLQPVLHDRAGLGRAAADRRAQDVQNMPEEAIFNWEPHGQFGIYLPDTFWYEQ